MNELLIRFPWTKKTSIIVIPFLCANIKSSSPICPPSNLFMSTLWVLSVQNKICPNITQSATAIIIIWEKKRNITRAPTGILSRESTPDSFCIIITCYKIQWPKCHPPFRLIELHLQVDERGDQFSSCSLYKKRVLVVCQNVSPRLIYA
jgi:hypothetical protein